MKKYLIFAATTLMLAAVSCSKEPAPIEEPEQAQPTVQKISFTAVADNAPETRTILEDREIKWAAHETIYVFDGSAPRMFTSTNTAEATVVTFEGEASTTAQTYTAVFPAATLDSEGKLNVTIPVYQTATANSFDPKANVAVAVANAGADVDLHNLTLQFKNAAAVVRFKLGNSDVKKVRLDALGANKKIAGKASITLDSNNIPTLTMATTDEATSCVILEPVSGTFDAYTTYAIAIAPGSYTGGFKITLINSEGKYKTLSNTQTQDLGRNGLMDFGTLTATSWKEGLVQYTDDLTKDVIGVSGPAYAAWNDISCSNTNHSSAVYAGESTVGNSSIQLRSDTNHGIYSGIVSTTSGGKVKKVTVVWNGGTVDGRKLDVYGKNTAYDGWSGASDLYEETTAGTLLGSIIKGTSTELTISGNYTYVGLRSNDGAMYLSKITIEWENGTSAALPVDPEVPASVFEITGQSPANGEIAVGGETASFVIHSTLPWTISTDDASIPYTLNASGNNTTVSATFGAITEGSRSLTFTVTSSEGAVKTVSFTQSYSKTYTQLFVITSNAVVSNSVYSKYTATVDNRGWVITYGGNNVSVGTNSNKRSNCNLSSYSKYAVSPVTTSSTASAFANTTKVDNVAKIKYVVGGGKNQSYTKVYLLYSSDNTSFSQVALTSTSPTQGGDIVTSSSGAEFEFEKRSGYFAVLFVATNTSGDWRLDDVNLTFYTY